VPTKAQLAYVLLEALVISGMTLQANASGITLAGFNPRT
jgi:hypothetical protein